MNSISTQESSIPLTVRSNRLNRIQQFIQALKFKFHGNWGGPGYPEQGTNPHAQDRLDEIFRQHDHQYARDRYSTGDSELEAELANYLLAPEHPINAAKAVVAGIGFGAKRRLGLSSDPVTQPTTSSSYLREDVDVPGIFHRVPSPPLVGVEPNPGPRPKNGGVPSTRALKRAVAGKKRSSLIAQRGANSKARIMSKQRIANMAARNGITSNFVTANVARGDIVDNSKLRKSQIVVIPRREYISDINGSTSAFSVPVNLFINPCNTVMFPWLSQLAKNFEMFRFRKLTFVYDTYAATTFGGYVAMATNFDASGAGFSTKQQLMDYFGASRAQDWVPFEHKVSISSFWTDKFFNLTGPQPASTDLKTFYPGVFNLAVGGQTAAVPMGELYVDYIVELIEPINNVNQYRSLINTNCGALWYVPSPGTGYINSLTYTTAGGGNLKPTLVSPNFISMPYNSIGYYLVSFYCANGNTGWTSTGFSDYSTSTSQIINYQVVNDNGAHNFSGYFIWQIKYTQGDARLRSYWAPINSGGNATITLYMAALNNDLYTSGGMPNVGEVITIAPDTDGKSSADSSTDGKQVLNVTSDASSKLIVNRALLSPMSMQLPPPTSGVPTPAPSPIVGASTSGVLLSNPLMSYFRST